MVGVKSGRPAGRSAAERDIDTGAPDSRAKKLLSWLAGSLGAILLGLFTALTAYYFQARSWEYQNAATIIQNDIGAVVKVLNDVEGVIEEKWLSTYAMNDAIKNKIDGDKWKAIVDRFYQADTKWETLHNSLAAEFAMSVDGLFLNVSPAGLSSQELQRVWPLDCLTYTLVGQRGSINHPLSAGLLLEIAYRCHGLLKTAIETQIRARDANDSHWPATVAEPDPGGRRLGHTWWIDKVMHCLLVERALEVRNSPIGVPLDLSTPRPETAAYSTSKQEAKCIERYENDVTFGSAAPKG